MSYSEIQYHLNSIRQKYQYSNSGFVIGALSSFNHAENFYITPIRYINNFAYLGVVVKNVNTAIEIAKIVDGKVKYIFVDSEKKILRKNFGINDSGNIEKSLNNIVRKSLLFTYKGNDLAVRATDSLLRVLAPNLTGAKIAIIGVGNLGAKIALSLLERGNDVVLYSSNMNHSQLVSQYLNEIKFQTTLSKSYYAKNLDQAFTNSNVAIGCSDKKAIIEKEHIKLMSDLNANTKKILIDVGKGCFNSEIISSLQDIYRVDIEDELSIEIIKLMKIYAHLNSSPRKKIGDISYVRQGLVGIKNEIIVDNLDQPTQVIGKCDGEGNLTGNENLRDSEIFLKLVKNI